MKIEKISPQIAALYLGAKCDLEWAAPYNDEAWKAIEIDHSVIEKLSIAHISITPHLRRLESITEDEAGDIIKLYNSRDAKIGDAIGSPTTWLYLLSKHFDLLGLIEIGLAKEIKPENGNA